MLLRCQRDQAQQPTALPNTAALPSPAALAAGALFTDGSGASHTNLQVQFMLPLECDVHQTGLQQPCSDSVVDVAAGMINVNI